MRDEKPYVFSSQYQQEPIPAGGTIFRRDKFPLLEIEPEMISTFICIDTAETEKTYNDATALTFFGLYKVDINYTIIEDLYALHCIDCQEIRVEPADLENAVLDFYTNCMRHKSQPKFMVIEKKSTGVTLASVLKRIRGLQVLDVQRTKISGGKTTRFLEMQEYVNKQLISLPKYGDHTEKVLRHMESITANNSHAHDDIADTFYDGTKVALIDKVGQLYLTDAARQDNQRTAKTIMATQRKVLDIRKNRYGSSRI